MSKTVLKVENVSKLYRLGEVGTGTISHDLNRWWARVRGKEDPFAQVGVTNDRTKKADSDYVWALQNINFEVKQGEVLGIIGRNGAGKSTLLKLISQITSPTTGSIKAKGRVAALLEVGTGMNPELSARENIFLNGAILGMRKHEITAKFDEIVDFSGCALYVDTPLKRYSSGMRVRLGFAVAAFLEPEILIVDEVLAVGDAEFQKKAIGKMKDVTNEDGRTVLFVSHNMAAVKSLCKRGIILENGQLTLDVDVDSAVSHYLSDGSETSNKREFQDKIRTEFFQLHSIKILNANGDQNSDIIIEDKEINIETNISFFTDEPNKYHVTFHMFNEQGEAMFSFSSATFNFLLSGENSLRCIIPAKFLQAGQYFLHLLIVQDKKKVIFIEKDIISFNVIYGERKIGVFMGREPGYIRPQFKWVNDK